MTTVIFSMGQHPWLSDLPEFWERGVYESKIFPDKERFLKVLTPVHGKHCLVFCNLVDPDPQMWAFLQLAATLRDCGALSVGLVTPYLPYMRQDVAFTMGEAVSARYFARVLSDAVDWLVTVNPHLHRIQRLNEIFSIPTVVVSVADVVAEWVKNHVKNPVIVGPDEESAMLASAVAEAVGCDWFTLSKARVSEREVKVSMLNTTLWEGRGAVVVDDIMSTGETMRQAARALVASSMAPPVCIGVHALLTAKDYQRLRDADEVQSILSVDTVSHSSNQIRLGPDVWERVSEITDSTLEFV